MKLYLLLLSIYSFSAQHLAAMQKLTFEEYSKRKHEWYAYDDGELDFAEPLAYYEPSHSSVKEKKERRKAYKPKRSVIAAKRDALPTIVEESETETEELNSNYPKVKTKGVQKKQQKATWKTWWKKGIQ